MFERGYNAPHVRLLLRTRVWRQMPMKLLKWTRKMPSTNHYNLVPNDEYDTRIPLHPDEAFQYGITFQAKYIGTMDVPRPTNRVEIVAAMRRVRYEFKAKGVKKRKVTFDVSTNGVRVTTRKKKKGKKNASSKLFGRSNKNAAGEGQEIMHHPIYRIFYVSHDSSDLKIFSYIARDGATNVFKCNVFKSNRKSQAMRIVRTVGQAFEVCHKMQANAAEPAPSTSSAADQPPLSDQTSEPPLTKEGASDCGASESGAASTSKVMVDNHIESIEPERPKFLELLPPPPRKEGKKTQRSTPNLTTTLIPDLPECVTKIEVSSASSREREDSAPLSAQHQLQLLKERLDQQAQQTRAAVAQLLLLRDQLAAEQAARCEAQARTHQLLVHNKELLEHIAALVAHLQERERGSTRPISAQHLTLLPQKKDVSESKESPNAHFTTCNGNFSQVNTNALINLIAQSNNVIKNVENNNIRLTPISMSPNVPASPSNGPNSLPSFEGMSNEQIQNYLISKFQSVGFKNKEEESTPNLESNKNQQFFQNINAFPNIPPLTNHFNSSEFENLWNNRTSSETQPSLERFSNVSHTLSLGHSQNSLYSNSQATTSKDSSPEVTSSDDSALFIMPLSHNCTLTATGEDGRVRLIVPVSPSPSSTNIPELQNDTPNQSHSETSTLKVPGADRLLKPAGPIIRSTSEKVPNRSEMMTTLRSQWTRHTTK